MKPSARWTDDCQGKKDYDGPLVEISTRYWPRGGGFHVLTPDGQWLGGEARPEVRPSASSSLLLRHGAEEEEESVELVTQDFTGDTEAEVKAAVERWVQEKFDEVSALLCAHFRDAPQGAL